MKLNIITLTLALAGVVVGLVALQTANNARNLALSEVVVEEVNALTTPVFDEESNTFAYLAIYDISVANMSGSAVHLISVEPATTAGGFLTLLKGEEVVSADVKERAFVGADGVSAVKANPALIKKLMKGGAEEAFQSRTLELGESAVVHLGLLLHPYDDAGQPAANLALASWQLTFDNGKTYIFRRGFPLYPVTK